MKSTRLSFLLLLFFLPTVASAQMSAHYINVGQADSILLEFKNAAILIDAGGEATGDTRDRDHLIDYLKKFFARRTDLKRTLLAVIISHPHLDHTKNLVPVLQAFPVKNFIDGGNLRGSGFPQLRSARTFAKTHGIRYRPITDKQIENLGNKGMPLFENILKTSDVEMKLLDASRTCENGNNDSLIVRVKYKEASYLFSGDAETESDPVCEAEVPMLVDFYNGTGLVDVDVYKVGHHGSANGTDEDLMKAMSPQISIISAGIHTQHEPGKFHAFQFGHPRENIVALLETFTTKKRDPVNVYTMPRVKKLKLNRRIEKAIYCTCWDGDIVVSTNESGTQFRITTSGR
jgi:competence protein ComEC